MPTNPKHLTRKASLVIRNSYTNESESSKAQVDNGLTHSGTAPDSDKREQNDENNPDISSLPPMSRDGLPRSLVWGMNGLGVLLPAFQPLRCRKVSEKPWKTFVFLLAGGFDRKSVVFYRYGSVYFRNDRT